MAESSEVGDYLYCNVCRIHHQQGKKHKYCLNHRKLCKAITSKFKEKIKQCHMYLKKPEIVDGELEPGSSFWCQFCEKKVPKHVTDRKISIRYGGLFEHLSSSEHRKKTHAYWKVNGGDKAEKAEFWLSIEDYTRYKTKCQDCLLELNKQQETNRLVVAEKIKNTEFKRAVTVAEQHQQNSERLQEIKTVNNSHGVLQNPTGWHNGVRVWRGGIVKTRPKQASIRASVRSREYTFPTRDEDYQHTSLPSLSRVARAPRNSSNFSSARGNVHTGAIPPWLRANEGDDEKNSPDPSVPIGPSYEEFKKHVDKRKKNKANPKRVGANFDRETKKDDNWLPSFGRVWNSGPRWHSRKEFKTEKKSTGWK